MNGLGAGIANSWIETYTQRPTPCINNSGSAGGLINGSGTLSTCLVWLVVGLVVGSMVKGNKK